MNRLPGVVERLRRAGVLQAQIALPALPEIPAEDAWPVKLVAGGGGLLAGALTAGFLIALFSFLQDAPTGKALLGVLCLAASVGIYRQVAPDARFHAQFALSIGLTGQLLLLLAMSEARAGLGSVAGAMAAVQLVLIALVRQPLPRLASSAAAGLCIVVMAHEIHHEALAVPVLAALAAWLWRHVDRGHDEAMPLFGGQALALLALNLVLASGEPVRQPAGVPAWIHAVQAVSAVALWWTCVQWTVLSSHAGQAGARRGAQSRLLLAAAPAPLALVLPGLLAASALGLLAFQHRRSGLLVLCMLASAGQVWLYYGSRQTTLLEKSVEMTIAGVLLAAAVWFARRRPTSSPEDDHA
jgi:hypothetical protein